MRDSMGGFSFTFWLVILAAALGLIWFFRSLLKATNSERRFIGREHLEERYARGEISRQEYLQKKRELEG
jgi:putative membrane protein